MIKSIQHSVLILSVVALFSACTESNKKESTEIPVATEKTECLYSFDASATKVFWAGYKTDDKLKVIGQFKELKTDRSDQQFSSLEELVNGINFSINTASSASGDVIRDLSLNEYFFQLFTENFEINGSLAEMNEVSITATINIFGAAKNMVLTYSITDEVLKMKGTLSLEDFGAVKAYNSIHEKCFDLHKGKTWDDVDVIIEVPILKDCK
ncbi:MAG: YceI family protein [Flavobacteriales bacterium]|jgi:hypothetical protein|tara:strand:+ start:2549 stop:3181 length:633 start_codon:yes stop_codon:yes gene_type:complete